MSRYMYSNNSTTPTPKEHEIARTSPFDPNTCIHVSYSRLVRQLGRVGARQWDIGVVTHNPSASAAQTHQPRLPSPQSGKAPSLQRRLQVLGIRCYLISREALTALQLVPLLSSCCWQGQQAAAIHSQAQNQHAPARSQRGAAMTMMDGISHGEDLSKVACESWQLFTSHIMASLLSWHRRR